MATEVDPIVQAVGGAGGVAGLSYLLWKAYLSVKSDNKSDTKGDNVDARINQFTSQLQAQLDKALKRADELQTAYNLLQAENAKTAALLAVAQTRAEYLATENQRLLADMSSVHQ